ncbi:thioredoxin domain-containing protein [Corynebacterium anserum]|uniref:Thioredoxin domain-containing protein n=1 Tax=Corynebacterium anserum TaxID=2684406 RepID=A0A7G7YME0_9CORY|nr:thioredoxin domain-containing protein [Corynebacterium anserum]MBC2681021.1 thioredoxin domain-containing protein [Corynebacterium anserum]QNH95660.1 thioredoxin domain-containing protein [Corynebacterium anserum]
MSQKIKAPSSKGGSGFVWAIVAIVAIAAVVIGLVVWNNSKNNDIATGMPKEEVNFSVRADGDAIVLKSDKAKQDAKKIEIFEDFSCPHCADLHNVDREELRNALNDGKIQLTYHFLNFLDGGKVGSSTRGAAVAMTIAKTGNAEAFWNMHDYFMQHQAEVARTWDYGNYADAASSYDLDESVIDSIRDGSIENVGQNIAKKNEDELKKRRDQVSSPVVYVDGKEFETPTDSQGHPVPWISELLKK